MPPSRAEETPRSFPFSSGARKAVQTGHSRAAVTGHNAPTAAVENTPPYIANRPRAGEGGGGGPFSGNPGPAPVVSETGEPGVRTLAPEPSNHLASCATAGYNILHRTNEALRIHRASPLALPVHSGTPPARLRFRLPFRHAPPPARASLTAAHHHQPPPTPVRLPLATAFLFSLPRRHASSDTRTRSSRLPR